MNESANLLEMIYFRPLYMERVWGGREMASRYGRALPRAEIPYGESWEVVDRAGEQSVVVGGTFEGLTLHELWTEHRLKIFGAAAPEGERFPLLIKILDAREALSIQVHPPVSEAAALHGEPKTELWVIAGTKSGACLYAGLQPGVTPESLATALADGSAAELVPQLPVKEGDFIFIPSGRLHAIGAGLLIFEIQQNSDTTYRVFDWNRVGLDGKPRALHVAESLRCIDFTDTAPALGEASEDGLLVACEWFVVHRREAAAGQAVTLGLEGEFLMPGVLSGKLIAVGWNLSLGDWSFMPAHAGVDQRSAVAGPEGAVWLEVRFGDLGSP